MEGNRRLQIAFIVVSAALFGFAYGVGYYIGKGAGIEEEKKICEMEKKQIVKTLARITPVSRPEPVEETVKSEIPQENNTEVSPKGENQVPTEETAEANETASKENNATNTTAPTQEKTEEKSVVKEETKPLEKNEKTHQQPVQQVSQKKEEVKPKIEGKYYLQLGVFRNKENAFKLVNRLKEKGFDAKTVYGKRYVKVIVGYFETKKEAMKVKRELRSLGIDSILRRRR